MSSKPSRRVLLFHKPRGAVVTRSDERGRKTVYHLLPDWVLAEGWVPVGRLDQDSTGLLLFVREGQLVERLTRPGLLRTYEVWVRGRVTEEHLEAIRRGIPSPVGLLTAVRVEVLGGAGPKTRLRVTLEEGKNRHVRRLFGALKDPKFGTPLKVLELKRTQLGGLALDVPSGAWRFLTEQEVTSLLARISHKPACGRAKSSVIPSGAKRSRGTSRRRQPTQQATHRCRGSPP